MPSSKGQGEWPEVWLSRLRPEEDAENYRVHDYRDGPAGGEPEEFCCYAPARQAHQTAYQSLVERLTSEEAVIAVAKGRHPLLANYTPAAQEAALFEARADLQAALDSIQTEVGNG